MALGLLLLACGWLPQPAHAQSRRPAPPILPPIDDGDFVCPTNSQYQIQWGAGTKGRLVLTVPQPPFYWPTGFIEQGLTRYPLLYHAVADPQDVLESEQGPGYRGVDSTLGHRIVMWVNFSGGGPQTWQRFDGYLMTITRDAIAGVTWSNDVPLGFYANDKQCIEVQP